MCYPDETGELTIPCWEPTPDMEIEVGPEKLEEYIKKLIAAVEDE